MLTIIHRNPYAPKISAPRVVVRDNEGHYGIVGTVDQDFTREDFEQMAPCECPVVLMKATPRYLLFVEKPNVVDQAIVL